MTGPKDRESGARPLISTVISIVALLVSVTSAYYSRLNAKDAAASGVIRESYNTFYLLNRLQLENYQLSHIFVLPDRYRDASSLVGSTLGSASVEEVSGFKLKERAIATLIFTSYEQTFYQWKQADISGDEDRAAFLLEVLNYFTGRLLRNPRLLFYWSPTGGGLSTYFEEDTREHYARHVLQDPERPLREVADSTGPFPVPDIVSREAANQP